MSRFTRREILAAAPALGMAAAAVGTLGAAAEVRADQPHMEAALDHLRAARKELDAAAPDKGGHRGAAIRAVNDAIAQVEKGIGYARRH